MIKIISRETVYTDSKHNAFTDLIFFKNKYYLAFRNGSKHLSKDGKIKILVSKDAKKWEEIDAPKVKGDVRDCKFAVWEEKLGLFFPVMKRRRFRTVVGSYISKLEDGAWETAPFIKNWVVWRPKVYNGVLHIPMFYHGRGLKHSRNWKVSIVKAGVVVFERDLIYEGGAANETEIIKWKDTMFAFIRREFRTSVLGWNNGNGWKFQDLGIKLDAPCAIPLKDRILLTGRNFYTFNYDIEGVKLSDIDYIQSIELHEFFPEKMELRWVKELTDSKNGDCGYCGMVKVPGKNEILISYYEGKVDRADIKIARVKVK